MWGGPFALSGLRKPGELFTVSMVVPAFARGHHGPHGSERSRGEREAEIGVTAPDRGFPISVQIIKGEARGRPLPALKRRCDPRIAQGDLVPPAGLDRGQIAGIGLHRHLVRRERDSAAQHRVMRAVGNHQARIGEQRETVSSGVSTLKFMKDGTKAWKPGDYRAEVWVGDEKVNDERFNIVSARSASK